MSLMRVPPPGAPPHRLGRPLAGASEPGTFTTARGEVGASEVVQSSLKAAAAELCRGKM